MTRRLELTGKRFGDLAVLAFAGLTNQGNTTWLVKCVCGTEKIVSSNNLIRGNSESCGCKQHPFKPNALSRLPEYGVWNTMRQRCDNPASEKYPRYGARGIRVCERWEKFENFLADMGRRPDSTYQIEREDNDGPYCPENCTWATATTQANNRSTTQWVTHDGRTLKLADWSLETGIPRREITKRLLRGWTIERALLQPLRPARRAA